MISGYKYQACQPKQSLLTYDVLAIIGVCIISHVHLHASVLAPAQLLHL